MFRLIALLAFACSMFVPAIASAQELAPMALAPMANYSYAINASDCATGAPATQVVVYENGVAIGSSTDGTVVANAALCNGEGTAFSVYVGNQVAPLIFVVTFADGSTTTTTIGYTAPAPYYDNGYNSYYNFYGPMNYLNPTYPVFNDGTTYYDFTYTDHSGVVHYHHNHQDCHLDSGTWTCR